jgi:hypothetical protein
MAIRNISTVIQQETPKCNTQTSSTPTEIMEIKTSAPQQQKPERKQVRFNLDNVTIKEIPSLADYNFIQLYQLYYKQSDMDFFRRNYEMNGAIAQDKAPIRSTTIRKSRKMAHLIMKQKTAAKVC